MFSTTHLVLFLHIGFLCIAGLGILLADSSAIAWLRGTRETIRRESALIAHWVVTTGLTGLILSGLYLFWPLRNYLLEEPLFWLKMVFVAALVINSFAIEHLMRTASRRSFRSLSPLQKLPFIVSGGVSTVSWVGAFLVAIALF